MAIKKLSVQFPTRFGNFVALQDFNLLLAAGEIHGLVGESGAGKSTIGAAIIGLLQHPGYISEGEIILSGEHLTHLNSKQYHRLRGRRISMIFQDPQTSLNPLLTIASQLVETIRQHRHIDVVPARHLAIELLEESGIRDAAKRIDDYPHQFSGGMRQRVVIALALCTEPELIIADEPTTALDVAVQRQILQLIQALARKRKVGIILITHDIGVINEVTDTVTVLRNGQIIEAGATQQILKNSAKSYTKSLLAAVPRLDIKLDRFQNLMLDEAPDKKTDNAQDSWKITGASAQFATQWLHSSRSKTRSDTENTVLSLNNITVTYPTARVSWFSKSTNTPALSNISFAVRPGEVLGIVGESGSGKSTLAKTIAGLIDPSAGNMQFNGQPLPVGSKRGRHHIARRQIQMVFQDPYSSLNNRKTVENIISEPLRFYGLEPDRTKRRKLVASMLEVVGMRQSAMLKYPHQFSGGQRQRIAIARSLVANPEFLICDEPTSALDVSIQAQILNLLKDLQSNFSLTIVFISHNLAVIRQMADKVIVLKDGQLIEAAVADSFFNNPTTAYSKLLLRETPSLANTAKNDVQI